MAVYRWLSWHSDGSVGQSGETVYGVESGWKKGPRMSDIPPQQGDRNSMH